MNRFDGESTANTSILWHVNGDFSSFNLCDQEISCLLQWIRLFWMWGWVPILKVELDVEIEAKSHVEKLLKEHPKATWNRNEFFENLTWKILIVDLIFSRFQLAQLWQVFLPKPVEILENNNSILLLLDRRHLWY